MDPADTIAPTRRRRVAAAFPPALAAGLVIAVACALAWPAPSEAPETVRATTPLRVVAIGDLHGRFDAFRALLRATGLVDKDLRWTGGRDRLVVDGDAVDRGDDERSILDLMMRLEKEAAAAGGSADLVLGNHEVMNMVADFRYVSPAGYAAFKDLEQAADRSRAESAVRAAAPPGEAKAAAERFARERPPGWFGRVRAFGPDGVYGQWLLGRPAMLVVDGTLFVHGGVSERTVAAGIDDTNRAVVHGVREFWRLRDVLEKAGAVPPFATFQQVQETVLELSDGAGVPEARSAARELRALFDGPMLAPDGPLWYRGSSLENERIERDVVAAALDKFRVRRIVVGHTPTKTRTVNARFGGGVYRVDVGIYRSNRARALVIEGEVTQVVDPDVAERLAVNVEAPQGEEWTGESIELGDAETERFLETGVIAAVRYLGRGASRPQLVDLESGKDKLRAIFKSIDTGDPGTRALPSMVERYTHEIAAYRVDRLLGLDMVPVTVARTIKGTRGSLQRWAESAVDQRAAKRDGLELAAPSLLPGQLARAQVFDALIGNPRRTEGDILYVLLENRVMLIDHARSFGTTRDARPFLREACSLDPAFATALRALDRENVQRAIGGLVLEGAVDALLARRDAILEICARP